MIAALNAHREQRGFLSSRVIQARRLTQHLADLAGQDGDRLVRAIDEMISRA